MSLDEFKVPLSSKVDGSWNLHTLLPSGLDFFILLASVSGACGTHGQANYAAANAFCDALALHGSRHGAQPLGRCHQAGARFRRKFVVAGRNTAGCLEIDQAVLDLVAQQ